VAKLTENQLYKTWLDIKYATECTRDFLHDLEIEIKLIRKQNKKNEKMLAQASDHYKSIYGKDPTDYKR